jgi:hypothetical protein
MIFYCTFPDGLVQKDKYISALECMVYLHLSNDIVCVFDRPDFATVIHELQKLQRILPRPSSDHPRNSIQLSSRSSSSSGSHFQDIDLPVVAVVVCGEAGNPEVETAEEFMPASRQEGTAMSAHYSQQMHVRVAEAAQQTARCNLQSSTVAYGSAYELQNIQDHNTSGDVETSSVPWHLVRHNSNASSANVLGIRDSNHLANVNSTEVARMPATSSIHYRTD